MWRATHCFKSECNKKKKIFFKVNVSVYANLLMSDTVVVFLALFDGVSQVDVALVVLVSFLSLKEVPVGFL